MIDLNRSIAIDISFIKNLPEKIKNSIKSLWSSYKTSITDSRKTTTKHKIASEIEKYQLDKDFDQFSRMSVSEIRLLYKRMFNEKKINKDKFRRLSLYIACHWAYDGLWRETDKPIKPPNGPKSKPIPKSGTNECGNSMVKFDPGLIYKDNFDFESSACSHVPSPTPKHPITTGYTKANCIIESPVFAVETDKPIDILSKAGEILDV
jgi:hypothetical protein